MKRLEDLAAFELAVQFKLDVYTLVRQSDAAPRDQRFKSQLFAAAASVEMNVAEGWGRGTVSEMILFLRYARGSLYEARRHVLDGVSRGYFTRSNCDEALAHADRCAGAITNLAKSLEPFTIAKNRGRGPKSGT